MGFRDNLASSYTSDVAPKNKLVDLGMTKETSYHSLVKVDKTTVELWYQRDIAYVWKHTRETDRNALYTVTGTKKDRLVITLNCSHEDKHEELQGSDWIARKNTCKVDQKLLYSWKNTDKLDIKFADVTEDARTKTSSEQKYKEKKNEKDAADKKK